MSDVLALLPGYLTAHLQLTLLSLGVGAAASVPLGIWVTRHPRLEGAVVGAASLIQTIPGLALLAVMVPALGALAVLASRAGLALRSIGFLPAFLALTLYSVLPILRNTVLGVTGVEPALVEAARGVGMTPRQRLFRVELPLALPVIVGGLRTAAVWVVGMATLSTPVGATSLGNFIFGGLQTRNDAEVLVGCVAAAALALLLDQLIRLLEAGLRERRRSRVVAALLCLAALCAWAGGAWALSGGREGRPVRIGSKTFTEQYVLADVVADWTRRETGRPTETLPSMGSTVLFDALRDDQIDLYVDYSGTIWSTLMKRRSLPHDRGRVTDAVERWLRQRYGITTVARLGFENTYALAMRSDRARSLGVSRISDLAPLSGRLSIGSDYEFFQRPEWAALVKAYGLHFRGRRSMDPALLYQAVARGAVDVISAYSTDGRIAALHLRVLDDDRGIIPPYDALLLASPGLRRRAPNVIAALRRLDGSIDAATMRRMNAAVDEEGATPAAVARRFVAGLGTGKGAAQPPETGSSAAGSGGTSSSRDSR